MRAVSALACLFVATPTLAACQVESGLTRARILELYTSEGCSSCPPADHWLSALDPAQRADAGWVPLAFHVDYWDRLGWQDRFAKTEYSARQRQRGSQLGWVYTPQFLHDGELLRPLGQPLPPTQGPAGAHLRLVLVPAAQRLNVDVQATLTAPARGARVYLALYENALTSRVRAGENTGRTLRHDYVVRTLAGPFAPGDIRHAFQLAAGWQAAHLGVAAWVETPDGKSLQAVAAHGCQSTR